VELVGRKPRQVARLFSFWLRATALKKGQILGTVSFRLRIFAAQVRIFLRGPSAVGTLYRSFRRVRSKTI
ncbi:uncharacterized protein METZ01_LOCUS341265, partial [marine metagenome]